MYDTGRRGEPEVELGRFAVRLAVTAVLEPLAGQHVELAGFPRVADPLRRPRDGPRSATELLESPANPALQETSTHGVAGIWA